MPRSTVAAQTAMLKKLQISGSKRLRKQADVDAVEEEKEREEEKGEGSSPINALLRTEKRKVNKTFNDIY